MQKINENGNIELAIEGRIDSNTSTDLQKQILEAVDKCDHLELNFAAVTYISSAGLRAVLMAQKGMARKHGTMELSNVTKFVMEVFQTVGFDRILSFK